MKDYIFLKTDVDDWTVSNTEFNDQTHLTLLFNKGIERQDGRRNVVISIEFKLEEPSSDSRLYVRTRSLFRILNSTNIIVQDIYDMYSKAVDDLNTFLEYKLGKGTTSKNGAHKPDLNDVMNDLLGLVTQLHSGA